MKLQHEYGQSWFLAAALVDGPRSLEQLKEYYHIVARRFGMFLNVMKQERRGPAADYMLNFDENLQQNLKELISAGWIRHAEGYYHITDLGREQAGLMLRDLEHSGRILEKATQPATVSLVTLIVHFVLAAVKLPAALLSGSVGLLNDSLDTLMDGISSLFVFFGVRANRERTVSYILLLFMSLTGLFSLYEAIRRFIYPGPLEGDLSTFIAVSISAALCGLLWLYQKFSGLRHSCVPLIAQSIDSRNHIIVAGGVAAGLVAAKFNFILLDQLVGLFVAGLILKGAAELLIDLLRSKDEEELDLSKYGFQQLDRQRHRQFVRWFLFEIDKGRISTRDEMFREAHAATDFNQIASLRALGLDQQNSREQKIEAAAEEIFARGLAEETPSPTPDLREAQSFTASDVAPVDSNSIVSSDSLLRLTSAGRAELQRALSVKWSLHFGRFRSLVIRILFSALFFTVTFAAARGLISLLNSWLVPLETWSFSTPLSLPFPLSARLGLPIQNSYTQAIFSFRSLTFTPIHIASFFIGFIFFYFGRMISHRASHAIHHARKEIPHKQKRDQDSTTKEKRRAVRSMKPRYLITNGPFALRRHPMYTGHLLICLGFAVALHSGYALGWSALAISLHLSGVLREERRLLRWFPQEYREYTNKVKRRFLSRPLWVIIGVIYAAAWIGIFF